MVDDNTKDILARHRIRESENVIVAEKSLKKLEEDAEDVDHALAASLRQISLQSGKRPNRNEVGNESKVITIEWDEELEEMKRDKADAEARAGESTYGGRRSVIQVLMNGFTSFEAAVQEPSYKG
jgi:hypothetical protein